MSSNIGDNPDRPRPRPPAQGATKHAGSAGAVGRGGRDALLTRVAAYFGIVAPLPTGVVTFVLTDVVGSTELWERVPEAMATALARHDEIVAGVVRAEGGSLVKSKGEGDSTFSAFARASDALRAAYRLQRTMRVEPWPTGVTIRTRVGVHTGEAVERDGDYFGPAVNRVARLRSVARGGEIIVSAATAAIVRTALPRGCELVALGAIELHGLEHPEQAMALVASDLEPISRSPPAAVRSLPADRRATRRQAEVLALVGENLTNAEIAARLYISERTVESHVSALLRKAGARDRHELARRAVSATAASPLVDVVATQPLPAMLELLADGSTFVGRDSERQTLRDRWQLARAGHTLVVVVSGEAGIGKSRLVSELAVDVHTDGGRVLLGTCYEDVDHPYDPFAQMISADAAELTEAELRERVQDDRDALIRLSPWLARALPTVEGEVRRSDFELSERGVVLDAIERWLVASAAAVPLLVVVEDLHWSTSSTRDVLRFLVRRAGRHPLLIVATTRDTAPDLDSDLGGLLADLERSPAVTRVGLRGLDVGEVADLIEGAPSTPRQSRPRPMATRCSSHR